MDLIHLLGELGKMVAWNEIEKVCRRIDFPEAAVDALGKCYSAITSKGVEQLQTLADDWLNPGADWRKCMENLEVAAKETGVPLNSARMVFFLYCTLPLRKEYQKRGLPESLYWETIQDLCYKLKECYALYGEWGTFVPSWYRRFYICELFALGRLQYEPIDFPLEGYKSGLKRGDRVYSCHIPSSGALREEDVVESLKRAYRFYGKELKDGILPVVCHSWLLYQPLAEVFVDSPNIVKFRQLFDVVANESDGKNGDFWRIFYKEFTEENLKTAPENTKLQSRVKDYLLGGNTLGCGWGVLLFDGEKIVNT